MPRNGSKNVKELHTFSHFFVSNEKVREGTIHRFGEKMTITYQVFFICFKKAITLEIDDDYF